jgi:hypothetical protein
MDGYFNVSAKTLTVENGVDSNKCSEGLGFSHFYVQSPCKSLVEDYTQTFYMIDKEG